MRAAERQWPSRAAEGGRRGLWFRTVTFFLLSLSIGLLGLNVFMLFDAPAREAAAMPSEPGIAPLAEALPSPRAPIEGYVASAAGIGRAMVARSQPVALLSTDAYAMVGADVRAESPRRNEASPPQSQATGGQVQSGVAWSSTAMPAGMSVSFDAGSIAESQARADEAMRVIAATTPSVHRTAARDPALVGDGSIASVQPQVRRGEPGVWYGDGGAF